MIRSAFASFTLLMRFHSPREEFLEGNWAPPGVRRVEKDAGGAGAK